MAPSAVVIDTPSLTVSPHGRVILLRSWMHVRRYCWRSGESLIRRLTTSGNFEPRSVVQSNMIESLSELRLDVRYGLRTLAASPGFAFVAVASLSLGIAVVTCAYSEVNGLIFRDIPGVRRAGELVALQEPSSYRTFSAIESERISFRRRRRMSRLCRSPYCTARP